MTDKEFLSWIYDRMIYKHGENKNVDYMLKFRSIIDSMQEECNITDIKLKHATGKLKELVDNVSEEGLEEARKQLQESVSEDLEKEIQRWAEIFKHNPAAMGYKETACHFAEWQKQKDAETLNQNALLYDARLKGIEIGKAEMKQQLMAKAVDGIVHHLEKCGVASVHYTDPIGAPMAYYISPEGLSAGDKVKIIVIKED